MDKEILKVTSAYKSGAMSRRDALKSLFRLGMLAPTAYVALGLLSETSGLAVAQSSDEARHPRSQPMPSFDKNAFISINKWYVSFIFHLKGKGEATKNEDRNHYETRWDILREVSGTFELDKVGDDRPKKSVLAQGEQRQGRFISWNVSVPLSSVSYLVADRVEHKSVTFGEAASTTEVRGFRKIQGAGTTQIHLSKQFRCDLKDMLFDMEISDLRRWNRENDTPKHLKLTGEYHSWTPVTRVRNDIEYPLEESGIFGILPEVTDPLLEQCFSRKLGLVNDKIEFTVSVPVTKP